MASPKFVFHLTCLFLGLAAQTAALSSSDHPVRGIASVKAEDNLTLSCFHRGDVARRLHWCKQPLRQKPQHINDTSHGEPEDKPSFTLHLTITNLTISDSATYACTYSVSHRNGTFNVTVEDRTKLGFEYKVDCEVLVYILSGALAFTSLLVVLLACTAIRMKKRENFRLQDSHARLSAPSAANDEASQEADNLHYATVCFNQPDGSGRQRNNNGNECIYSSVRP